MRVMVVTCAGADGASVTFSGPPLQEFEKEKQEDEQILAFDEFKLKGDHAGVVEAMVLVGPDGIGDVLEELALRMFNLGRKVERERIAKRLFD